LALLFWFPLLLDMCPKHVHLPNFVKFHSNSKFMKLELTLDVLLLQVLVHFVVFCVGLKFLVPLNQPPLPFFYVLVMVFFLVVLSFLVFFFVLFNLPWCCSFPLVPLLVNWTPPFPFMLCYRWYFS
jgi:hypothetical protein